ncbi:DUF3310 domain-containing protein [Staphylococcus felis]|uniref:DUF3310 domain-containing protein n=1 Tax=Staphylococcus felis TaxID=46127 RepID=UPI0021D158BF|nr:DUF3310 domain-containing protein [Staphylococcus felis]UXR86193.1 DUF3310 domain-containing protein [Staphylococcus felis]UXR87113.1 DUF3310 domain-containing protein [Staphylococcus felis]
MSKIKDLKVNQKIYLFFDNDWHLVTVVGIDYQQEIAKVKFEDNDWTMIDDEDEFRELTTYSEVDYVNKPPHYTYGDIEIIDVIEQVIKDYPPELGFSIGNAIKYISRATHKNGKEDLAKARWYLERAYKKWEVTSND